MAQQQWLSSSGSTAACPQDFQSDSDSEPEASDDEAQWVEVAVGETAILPTPSSASLENGYSRKRGVQWNDSLANSVGGRPGGCAGDGMEEMTNTVVSTSAPSFELRTHLAVDWAAVAQTKETT